MQHKTMDEPKTALRSTYHPKSLIHNKSQQVIQILASLIDENQKREGAFKRDGSKDGIGKEKKVE